MQTEMKETKTVKSRKKLFLTVLAAGIALIFLLLFFIAPVFISSNKGRRIILDNINQRIDGQAEFDTLTMGWFKGINVKNFNFNDNKSTTHVSIKEISTKPNYGNIIFGNLSFGKTIIDNPRLVINLKDPPVKKNNTSAPIAKKSEKTATVMLPIERIDLKVNNGDIQVNNPQTGMVIFSEVNSEINLRPPGKQTNFALDMAIGEGDEKSDVSAAGQVTPDKKAGWTFDNIAGNLTVEVNQLNIGSLASFFALAGIDIQAGGTITTKMESKIESGRIKKIKGIIKGKNVDIAVAQLKNDKFKTELLDVAIDLESEKELINVNKLKIDADWLKADISGPLPQSIKSLEDFIKADSKQKLTGSLECDIAQVATQMPHTLKIRPDTKITSGKLTAAVKKTTEDGQGKLYGQAAVENLTGSVKGKIVSLTEPIKADLLMSAKGGGAYLDKLTLNSSFCKANCAGNLNSLKYDAEIELAKVQSELGSFIEFKNYTLAGSLASKGNVVREKDKISTTGSAEIRNLILTDPNNLRLSEPAADIDFSVIFPSDYKIAKVGSIQADTSFGQIIIKKAILPLGGEIKELNLPVSAKLDLGKVRPFAAFFIPAARQMQIGGSADSQALVTADNGVYNISTDKTKIENFRFAYAGKQPFEQNEVTIIGKAQFSPAGKYSAKFTLSSPQIKIIFDSDQIVESGSAKLKGKVQLDYDWKALSSLASQFLPTGFNLYGKRKDTINFASQYPVGQTDKLLSNLDTKGQVGFDRAEYMGLNFGAAAIDIQVQKGLLKISPFSAAVNNGKVNFAAQADFSKKPTLLRTPGQIQIIENIQINDATTKKLLMYLNPIFADAINVSGTANLNCETLVIPLAGASKNDIIIIGTVSLDNVRLQASDLLGQIVSLAGGTGTQTITVRPTKFVLQNGFLRYDDMQMDIGNNPVNFKGVIGLDNSLDMRITLPYTTKGRAARTDRETEGTRITLPLKGTLDKPELDLAKLLQEQLMQKALEGLFKN